MTASIPPVFCLVGTSNSGKTTLMTRLIKIFKQRGLRVGTIKHHPHAFDIDHEGKDSWLHQQAGADAIVITTPSQTALIRKTREQLDPREIISHDLGNMDIVLIEGFKHSSFPKIEVHRQAQRPDLICRGDVHDPHLIAIASDRSWECDVPVFPLNAVDQLADFILKAGNVAVPAAPK